MSYGKMLYENKNSNANGNVFFEPEYSNMDDSMIQDIENNHSEFLGIGKGKVKKKLKKVVSKAKTGVKNATSSVKSGVKDATSSVKSGVKKATVVVKKTVTSVKQKVGKAGKNFRNKFRSIMRKDILSKISRNIHGSAVKLYPAVAPASELNKRTYRPAYLLKSKKTYSELLSRWIQLGGTEAELKTAIINGHTKKRFLKNPYKSFNGENDSYSFYSYFSSVDGVTEEGYVTEEGIEEIPTEEEKLKGIRGFFAWLKSVFGKNGANENPYEIGSAEALEFSQDMNEDKGNEPLESEANNDIMKEIVTTSTGDDAGGDTDLTEEEEEEEEEEGNEDKILGMSKPIFWTVTGLSAALVIGLVIWKIKGK